MAQMMQQRRQMSDRIAFWMIQREMSQGKLAATTGLSQSYISRVANGEAGVSTRSAIMIAEALGVTVANLWYDGDPTDPRKGVVGLAVPALRFALIRVAEGDVPQTPDRDAATMLRVAATLRDLSSRAEYAALVSGLPLLMLDAASHGGVIQAQVFDVAATVLARIGERDLALAAARVAVSGAEEAEHLPWVGATEFRHAELMPHEATGLRAAIAERAADLLQSNAADPDARQMLTQLHLSAALAHAVEGQGEHALSRLASARAEADTLGDPVDGRGFGDLFAGPQNVANWEMAIMIELDEFERALEIFDANRPDAVRCEVADRLQMPWQDQARALVALGGKARQGPAIHALRQAEKANPLAFSMHPLNGSTVQALVKELQRDAVPPDLRAIAGRVGVNTGRPIV